MTAGPEETAKNHGIIDHDGGSLRADAVGMSVELFKVEPVTSYEDARYPAAFDAATDGVPAPDETQRHPAMLVLSLVLLVGIAVGLIGCYLRTDYHQPDPTPIDGGPDGGDGGDGGPPPGCDDGALRCADPSTVSQCVDGEWVAEACGDVCLEELGAMAYSLGCDATAADPCQCMDDIMAGEPIVCTPGDIMCLDDWTLGRCDEAAWDYVPQDCNTFCVETYGYDYYSQGCDATAADPCQCEYGMIDGEMMVCEPGDVICLDEATLGVCDEAAMDYLPVACADRCVEQLGAGATSAGCDATATDPCECEPPPDEPAE
jgi:hypothetical protein